MAANMPATNTTQLSIPQVELRMNRADLESFALGLLRELFDNSSSTEFDLQIQATGKTPTTTSTISAGAGCTVTVHHQLSRK